MFEITVNQILFFSDENIHKSINVCPQYVDRCIYNKYGSLKKFADHIRYYRTNENDFIMTVSPYDVFDRGIHDIEAFSMGFEKTQPLYDEDATTYIKRVQSRKRKR